MISGHRSDQCPAGPTGCRRLPTPPAGGGALPSRLPSTQPFLCQGLLRTWRLIRPAGRRSDFPELRNFQSRFAAVHRNRGIPLRFRFFYALPQGLARSCEELILKVKLRGEFSIFSALFSPLFEGWLLRCCWISVTREKSVADWLVWCEGGLRCPCRRAIRLDAQQHPYGGRSSGPNAGLDHRPSHPRPDGPCRRRPSWSPPCRPRGGRSS